MYNIYYSKKCSSGMIYLVNDTLTNTLCCYYLAPVFVLKITTNVENYEILVIYGNLANSYCIKILHVVSYTYTINTFIV